MIGDVADLFSRLKRVLPQSWFGPVGETPVVDALLQAPATALSGVHGIYAFAKLQTRISTATGGWLDLIALDFFGGALRRRTGQTDASFRAAILAELLRPKVIRQALSDVLLALTGTRPRIFEPRRASDTGGYDVGGCGYDIAGGYGCEEMPAQLLVEVLRPRVSGIPNVSGYDLPYGALDTASPIEWAPDGEPLSAIDADVYAAIERVRPVGVTVWVRIVESMEEFSIVGGRSGFSDGTLYDDGSGNYQPPVLA